MINCQEEQLLSLSEACRAIKPKKISMGTISRWYLRGIHGVRLETVMVGGRRYTSAEALDRFIQRRTSGFDSNAMTSNQRDRLARAAQTALADAGV